ncbi:hypothetical protein AB1484_27695 [Parafrankia sp. FMc6]|uniref:hypothetical protein n=1 Tax=Parafrankia soli TaxID=2599596 RepID=UPI0034D67C40
MAGHIKRARASRDEMEARYDALYEIAAETQPTGLRFIYYTATTRGIVEKTDSGYNKVQRAILDMRRADRIPWHWIVDTNRWMRKPTTWSSLDEMLANAAASYRRDLWAASSVLVEVWCESESVAGVINDVTHDWDVPLYPIKGQTSDSFAWGAAQNFKDDLRRVVIYYVGDHDPHGYEIETNLNAKLREHSGRDDITFIRLGCTQEQVDALDLPGGPPKKSTYVDKMTGDKVQWNGLSVEVEALDPRYLRELVESAICEHLDPERLAMLRHAEESEREILTRMRPWAA